MQVNRDPDKSLGPLRASRQQANEYNVHCYQICEKYLRVGLTGKHRSDFPKAKQFAWTIAAVLARIQKSIDSLTAHCLK